MEKAREFQKNIYFCFFDYAKAFDCVDHNTTAPTFHGLLLGAALSSELEAPQKQDGGGVGAHVHLLQRLGRSVIK